MTRQLCKIGFRFLLVVAAGVLGILTAYGLRHNEAFAAEWKPTCQLEMIISARAGSGLDHTARIVQRILQENKFVPSPIIALNRPGGAYAVAFGYLDRFPGDGHRLFMVTSSSLTAFITGEFKSNYFDYTPIANLINEPVVFVVRPDSSIKNAQDLVARLKKDPGAVTIAIAGALGNAFHITWAAGEIGECRPQQTEDYRLYLLGRRHGAGDGGPRGHACGDAGEFQVLAGSQEDNNDRDVIVEEVGWHPCDGADA